NWHTENRQPRVRCNHSSQMCSTACAGDDHSHPAIRCASRELCRRVGRPMSGQHTRFVCHAESIQCFHSIPHGVPVRFTSHDDGNQRLGFRHGHIVEIFRERPTHVAISH